VRHYSCGHYSCKVIIYVYLYHFIENVLANLSYVYMVVSVSKPGLLIYYSFLIQEPTLTRSAPSLAMFPSVAVSWLEHVTVLRWTGLLLLGGIISILSRSTRGIILLQSFCVHFVLFRFVCLEKHNYNSIFIFMLRYEKRHSNIPAHISPAFRVKEGDHVIIGQCRWDYIGETFCVLTWIFCVFIGIDICMILLFVTLLQATF